MVKVKRSCDRVSFGGLTGRQLAGVGGLVVVWGLSGLALASDLPTTQSVAAAVSPSSRIATVQPQSGTGLKQRNGQLEQPTVPPLPDNIPTAVAPDPNGIVGLVPGPDETIGIGHLRPANMNSLKTNVWQTSPLLNAQWLQGVVVPIYVGPDAEHWGWLVNGWLIPNGYDPIAVGRDATFSMVQAYRGLYSFPVMEVRPDGWFRFQYTPAGTAWAHLSHLGLGPTELTVETWEDWVGEVSQIEFRSHGVSQALRAAPDGAEPLQSLIGPNSIIEPLDVEGDWMRVRVTQPAEACTPLPGANSEEGWMRWRDSDQNPLVWYPAEECL
jgi:hypothetical protein